MLILWSQGLLLCVLAGKALEKAGGKEFLETVKELRKSQGPLEVAEGKKDTTLFWKQLIPYVLFSGHFDLFLLIYVPLLMWCRCFCFLFEAVADTDSLLREKKKGRRIGYLGAVYIQCLSF